MRRGLRLLHSHPLQMFVDNGNTQIPLNSFHLHPSAYSWLLDISDIAKKKKCLLKIPILNSQVAPVVKNPPANARDAREVGSIPGLGRRPGEGNGNPLHYSCWEKSMGRGTWWAIVHEVTKSQTQRSTHTQQSRNFHSLVVWLSVLKWPTFGLFFCLRVALSKPNSTQKIKTYTAHLNWKKNQLFDNRLLLLFNNSSFK